MKVLDVGGAGRKYPNSICIDKANFPEVDAIWDLENTPLPFSDNEFDMVHASHIFEHIKNQENLLKELHRITKNNGLIVIRVPHFSCAWAYAVGHVNLYALDIFENYMVDYPYQKTEPRLFKTLTKRLTYYAKSYGIHPQKTIHWWAKILYIPARIIDFFANLNQLFCERFWVYWFGGFGEIYLELQVVK